MPTYTYDEEIFSDLYKEVNGFRPREFCEFFGASPARKQVLWDALLVELDEVNKQEEAREKAAIVEFEELIQKNIEVGAPDRKTAIRWLVEAHCDEYFDSASGLCYEFGLPYEYKTVFEEILAEMSA